MLRAGEEEAHGEAKIGAVVPSEQLPAEPALAELPVDPVIAGEAVPAAAEPEAAPARHYAGEERARR